MSRASAYDHYHSKEETEIRLAAQIQRCENRVERLKNQQRALRASLGLSPSPRSLTSPPVRPTAKLLNQNEQWIHNTHTRAMATGASNELLKEWMKLRDQREAAGLVADPLEAEEQEVVEKTLLSPEEEAEYKELMNIEGDLTDDEHERLGELLKKRTGENT
jgi:hypothetical protein